MLLAAAAPALTTPASADAAKLGKRTLKMRSHGSDVRELQRKLTKLGFRATVDGYYGRGTRAAVTSFEKANDMRVDRKVSRKQGRGIRRRVKRARAEARAQARAEAQARQGDRKQQSSGPSDAPKTVPGDKAVLGPDGRTALAPESAPQAVKDAIAAANEITRKRYRYGGGHASFKDSGYDCSGAVSYAMHGGDLLDRPMDSTGFMSWGKRGKGEWITTYAHGGHVYVIIAGLRFDTSGRGEEGPRWREEWRSGKGFTKRHPAGF